MKINIKRLLSSKYFRFGFGITISAVSLYLALKNVSLEEVWTALTQADPGFIGLALVSVGVNTLAKALRWEVLLGPKRKLVAFFKTLMVLLMGQMLNTLYPGRIGDLSRAYALGGSGLSRTFVLGTVVLEKIVEMLSYSILFILLLLLIPLPSWVGESGYTFAAITVVVSLVVYIVTYQRERFTRLIHTLFDRFPTSINNFVMDRLQSGLSSLDVLQSGMDLYKIATLSALVWGTAVLNNHLALRAMGISLPLVASLLILVALQAGISIPSVPGKIGVFEYICVLALGVYGVEQATALSYGIVLHAIVLLPTTLLGLAYFLTLGIDTTRKEMAAYSSAGDDEAGKSAEFTSKIE